MKQFIIFGLNLVLALGMVGCAGKEEVFKQQITLNSKETVTSMPRSDKWWMDRHEAVVNRIKQGNVDLVMIGDSITRHWENTGKAMWDQYYAPRNAVNMGYSADRTQHVLWRLDNGEIAGISPKLAVIMIGTNNSGSDKPQDIADGIIAICQKLRTNLPKTKILLLAIFPRADRPDLMPVINQTNELITQITDNKHIYFLDINNKFLNPDSTLPKSVMPDLLHPNEKGYEIWAKAQEPMIKKLMKD